MSMADEGFDLLMYCGNCEQPISKHEYEAIPGYYNPETGLPSKDKNDKKVLVIHNNHVCPWEQAMCCGSCESYTEGFCADLFVKTTKYTKGCGRWMMKQELREKEAKYIRELASQYGLKI